MISIWVVAFTRPNAYLDLCRLNLVFGIFEKIFWLQCLFINCPPKLAFSKMMSLCNQKLNILQKKYARIYLGYLTSFYFFILLNKLLSFLLQSTKEIPYTLIFLTKKTRIYFLEFARVLNYMCVLYSYMILLDTFINFLFAFFLCILQTCFIVLLFLLILYK